MALPRTSVVVVSRGRPDDLARCLTGLSQLWHDSFEIIVVADPAGIAATAPWAGLIKTCPFDEPNIATARNLGIAQAAGEIVAFIDDDAVPEPSWLTHLTAPFLDPNIAQTGGFVRGRNGISFQWRARVVGELGQARDVDVPGDEPFVPDLAPGDAIKTEGTNMAVRRSVLAQIGGFDPGFRFYLDETDLNRRLMGQGTMLVPLAQVHHGSAPSPRRAPNRAVRDLTDIGRSTALFIRKHAGEGNLETGWNSLSFEQDARLQAQLKDGRLTRDDTTRLRLSLGAGFEEGRTLPITPLPPLGEPQSDFLPFIPKQPGTPVYLAGRLWSRKRLMRQARAARVQGHVVTVLTLSHTPRPHHMRFLADGVWEQRGGLFGPSDRDQPIFRLWSFSKRLRAESARLEGVRKK